MTFILNRYKKLRGLDFPSLEPTRTVSKGMARSHHLTLQPNTSLQSCPGAPAGWMPSVEHLSPSVYYFLSILRKSPVSLRDALLISTLDSEVLHSLWLETQDPDDFLL